MPPSPSPTPLPTSVVHKIDAHTLKISINDLVPLIRKLGTSAWNKRDMNRMSSRMASLKDIPKLLGSGHKLNADMFDPALQRLVRLKQAGHTTNEVRKIAMRGIKKLTVAKELVEAEAKKDKEIDEGKGATSPQDEDQAVDKGKDTPVEDQTIPRINLAKKAHSGQLKNKQARDDDNDDDNLTLKVKENANKTVGKTRARNSSKDKEVGEGAEDLSDSEEEPPARIYSRRTTVLMSPVLDSTEARRGNDKNSPTNRAGVQEKKSSASTHPRRTTVPMSPVPDSTEAKRGNDKNLPLYTPKYHRRLRVGKCHNCTKSGRDCFVDRNYRVQERYHNAIRCTSCKNSGGLCKITTQSGETRKPLLKDLEGEIESDEDASDRNDNQPSVTPAAHSPTPSTTIHQSRKRKAREDVDVEMPTSKRTSTSRKTDIESSKASTSKNRPSYVAQNSMRGIVSTATASLTGHIQSAASMLEEMEADILVFTERQRQLRDSLTEACNKILADAKTILGAPTNSIITRGVLLRFIQESNEFIEIMENPDERIGENLASYLPRVKKAVMKVKERLPQE